MRWFGRSDREYREELEAHIEMAVRDNLERGMTPDEARQAALRAFGSALTVRENLAEARPLYFLQNLYRDMRFGLRSVRRNPGLTATVVLILALGVGGNTAMFTVVRAVLLKPLAYREPDQLVRVSIDDTKHKDIGFTLTQYDRIREVQSFSGIAAFFIGPESLTLASGAGPEGLKGARVSAGFLSVLGIKPLLGREFIPEEDRRGGRSAAMIAAELWEHRFGGDPSIAGKTISLDSIPYTVVGVLPRGFAFPFPDVDVWVSKPAEFSGTAPQAWSTSNYLVAVGRLRSGASIEQARAELDVAHRQYESAHPAASDGRKDTALHVTLLMDQLVSNVRPMLWTLFGAVGLVLLIACANVASLMLARTASRSRELAIRLAIGAGRSAIMRHLLSESILMAGTGGGLGILFAISTIRLIVRTDLFTLPRAGEIRLDGAVLAFTFLVSVATGVLIGLFPALTASRPDLAGALRENGGTAREGPIRRRFFGFNARGLLVVGQVALSIVLVIGASLLTRSLLELHRVDTGMRPEHVVTMQIPLPPARYDTGQKRAVFFSELVRRVEALPFVRAAAVALTIPTRAGYASAVAVTEQPPVRFEERPEAQMQSVTPDYFRTLGVSLRRGREFREADGVRGAPLVLIVNESLVRRFWPAWPLGVNPVGQHIVFGNQPQGAGFEIVGVVADVHEKGLVAIPGPEFYLPGSLRPPQTGNLVVRAEGDPLRLVNGIRAQVVAIDSNQPISNVKTMDDLLESTVGRQRLMVVLLGFFASAALLLAVIGLYGVISYSVVRRTPELAVRRALGADRKEIMRLVMGEGLALTVAGVWIGIGTAIGVTRAMQSLLFGISPTDPATFLGIALAFILVALAATYLPARAAARVDPIKALR